jgi:hypothetical protein
VASAAADEKFRAFQALEAMAGTEGPGLILTDFVPLKYGHSLSVAVHPFNAAENDRLDTTVCRWMGLVTEVHYVPFLKARFPEAKWYWFHPTPPSLEGGMALGIIPLGTQDRKWVDDWLEVHHSFHRLNLEAERGFNGPRYFQKALEDTWELRPRVQGDRFLESVYWDWVAQFNFGSDPSIPTKILAEALGKGYPVAHSLERMSQQMAQVGDPKDATQFHQRALDALRQVQKEFP